MTESPQSWRKPWSWWAVPANLGPVAAAAPPWSTDCPALQPVPEGSRRFPVRWLLPSPDPVFLSGLLLSVHDTRLQLPGGQKEGAVSGRPEPNPAGPGCCVTKAGSVFAAALTPSVSPPLLGGLSQTRPACSLSPLTFQWASCRSVLLSLCFSFVVFLALRTAWGL